MGALKSNNITPYQRPGNQNFSFNIYQRYMNSYTHLYFFLIHVYWWYRQYTQKLYGANKIERRNWKGPTTCTLLTTLPATAVRSDFPGCSLLLCEANSVQHVILRRGSLVVYQCQLHVGSQHYQRQELILRINIYNF